MNIWTAVVSTLAGVIEATGAMLGGGDGVGILVVTFVLRSALIPLLGPMGIRTRDRHRVVRRIRPQLKELDQRLKDHPNRLSKELKKLHADNGINVVDWAGLGAAMVQLPILIATFQAVLHVWEAQALTLSGGALGVVAAGLSVFGVRASGQAEGATWMLWLSGALPVAICLWLGPGVGLYLTAFYGAAAIQAMIMRGRGGQAAHPEAT